VLGVRPRLDDLALVVCAVQLVVLGPSTSFFVLAGLSGALCLALALWKGETPFGQSLTYWDEAAWFGLIACLI
jgi:glucose dehydrogenase